MERRNLFSVLLGHIFHNLSERCVVNIHIRHKHKSGELIFLADIPRLLRADFHTGLTGYYNNSRVRRAHSLFHLAYEIKKAGGIQHINLCALPLDRNNRRSDGNMAFLLLLTKITHRVPVVYPAHSGRDAGKVSHRLHQTGLTAAPMPQ